MLRSAAGRSAACGANPSPIVRERQAVPTGPSWQARPGPSKDDRVRVFAQARGGVGKAGMTPLAQPSKPTLARRLDAALLGDGRALDALANAQPVDLHDAAVTLLAVHDLHVAPLEQLDARVRWQHHPAVAALKCRLEEEFLERLDRRDRTHAWELPDGAPAALRALGVLDQVPAVYRFVADDADYDELVDFLTLEGGPDGGFDDLVAACQIGLDGEPKLELARNYWEIGRASCRE